MKKHCSSCGSEMALTLNSVFYGKKLELKNVPVYSCVNCEKYELIDQIKQKLLEIVYNEKLANRKKVFYFDKYCEFAQLITMAFHLQGFTLDTEIHEEIEHLLEDFLSEDNAEEDYFKEEVHKKVGKYLN